MMNESELNSLDAEASNKVQILETPEERRVRQLSLKIIYFTMFLMTLGFSIILTGIWPYLDKLDKNAGKEFMGYIIAANPLGQFIFSPIFGWWANKASSVRTPFIVSMIIFCFASAMYSCLDIVENNVKCWMVFARFFVGVSSANIVICRSYVSAATTLKERTKAVSLLTLAQTLGFIFGPMLQGLFTPLGGDGIKMFYNIPLSMYTAPGWLNVFLGLLNLILFLPKFFQDKRVAAREQMLMHGKESEKETWKAIKPDYLVSWALIFSLFVFVFNFVLLESLATPLTMDQFAWTKKEALENMAYIMTAGGIIACGTFMMISPLCKKFKENDVLIYGGFFLMILGRFTHIPYGTETPKLAYPKEYGFENGTYVTFKDDDDAVLGCPFVEQKWCTTTPKLGFTEFIIGYLLTSFGYPIGLTLIQTIFSKVLGPRPQGNWMGLMTNAGCLSRIFGPICVSMLYTRFGTLVIMLFTLVLMLIPMIWLFILKDRLYIEDFKNRTVEMEDMSERRNLQSEKDNIR
ncbi:major facilitator superfamily domain-containing protein 8-like [Chironomus tepperi]|uniref:major facilitator superfamily domain-containing protein 8-like n=1 Tax=Chironomus tepperi TaxID=113505 RepID=UPI00391F7F17